MSILKKLEGLCGDLSRRHCAAVILAGGSGSRFSESDSLPKQFTPICGMPMIAYSLKAFDSASEIEEIVVVSRKDDLEALEKIIKNLSLKRSVKVVLGGKTRQESALCGFEATSDRVSFIALHDAARPLITPTDIDETVRSAYRTGATIAAERAVDTPKIVSRSGYVCKKAPDRSELWHAQTPQVFSKKHYRVAAYYAKSEGFEATDDASLFEYAGFKVKVCEIKEPNFKVTKKSDALLAEAIISERKRKENAPNEL